MVGRKAPTEAVPEPPAFRMKLFAPNEVIAKSRFWYFMHQVRAGQWWPVADPAKSGARGRCAAAIVQAALAHFRVANRD